MLALSHGNQSFSTLLIQLYGLTWSRLFSGSGNIQVDSRVRVSVAIAVTRGVGVAVAVLLRHILQELQGPVDIAFVQSYLNQERGVVCLLQESEQFRSEDFPATKLSGEVAELLVVLEQALGAEQRFGHLYLGRMVIPSVIVVLEPCQDAPVCLLFDAPSHQTLGCGVLLMMNEEVCQSQH